MFERIQVWPSVLPEAAELGVEMADHAGFYETALTMAAHPDLPDLDQLGIDAPWFTNTAASKAGEATVVEGQRMFGFMIDAWVKQLAVFTEPKRPKPGNTVK